MVSKWYESKEAALAMRRSGMSMVTIEKKLGIPRSTLSGWFRTIVLTEGQRTRLMKNSQDGWKKAREKALEWHRAQKSLRLLEAETEASKTLDELVLSPALLDIALAMLYMGEGAKKDLTSLANSDPKILRFFLAVLRQNYGIENHSIRCDLHLRMDQDAVALKEYWAKELDVPLEQFKYVAFDKRSSGRPTYDHYKGVCVISCGHVAIQRKLVYLYNLFCERVAKMDMGV